MRIIASTKARTSWETKLMLRQFSMIWNSKNAKMNMKRKLEYQILVSAPKSKECTQTHQPPSLINIAHWRILKLVEAHLSLIWIRAKLRLITWKKSCRCIVGVLHFKSLDMIIKRRPKRLMRAVDLQQVYRELKIVWTSCCLTMLQSAGCLTQNFRPLYLTYASMVATTLILKQLQSL